MEGTQHYFSGHVIHPWGGSVPSHSSAIQCQACWAATADMPAQRWPVACRASMRRKSNSAPKPPPTSSANTGLQRRAAKSSGYVIWRLGRHPLRHGRMAVPRPALQCGGNPPRGHPRSCRAKTPWLRHAPRPPGKSGRRPVPNVPAPWANFLR